MPESSQTQTKITTVVGQPGTPGCICEIREGSVTTKATYLGEFNEGGGPWREFSIEVLVDGQLVGTSKIDNYGKAYLSDEIQEEAQDLLRSALNRGLIRYAFNAEATQEVA